MRVKHESCSDRHLHDILYMLQTELPAGDSDNMVQQEAAGICKGVVVYEKVS